MNMDVELVEKVWSMREDGLRRRAPSWVLQSFWVPFLVLPIPAMLSDFSPGTMLSCVVAGAIFAAYAGFTYLYWNSRHRRGTALRGQGTLLVVLGYDGFLLLFFSLTFLAGSIMSLRRIPEDLSVISMAIGVMYFGILVTAVVRGSAILRYIAAKMARPLSPEMRWLLGLPAALISAGVAASAITRALPVGWTLAAGMTALGAFILAPFAALTLYQIPMFLLSRKPRHLTA
jgi:hypothetical protein